MQRGRTPEWRDILDDQVVIAIEQIPTLQRIENSPLPVGMTVGTSLNSFPLEKAII